MTKSITSRVGTSRWTSGSDTVSRIDFDRMSDNIEQRVLVYGQGVLSARPAASVVGRQWYTTGDSTAINNGKFWYDDGTQWVPHKYLQNGISEASDAASVPFIARGVASQTADFFRVEASDTTPSLRVNSANLVTTQATAGVAGTAGVYLGKLSSHDAALGAISVATNKPVLVIAGASGQTADLVSVRNSTGATMASVSPGGNAVFAGNLTAVNITASTALTAPSITSNTSASLTAVTVAPTTASGVPLTVSGLSSQTANLIEFKDNTGTVLGRVGSAGGFATNGRISVGVNGTGTSALTGPVLTVQNSLDIASPIARLTAYTGQASGNLFEILTSTSANRFTVDFAGNTIQTGTSSQPKVVVGSSAQPTIPFSGTTPILEAQTGTAAGTYDENIVVRHANNDTSAVSRKLTLQFKQSGETSSGESAKWSGIGTQSTVASAATSDLVFYTSGSEAGRFDSSNNLTVGGNVSVGSTKQLLFTTQTGYKIGMYAGEGYSIGVQSSTFYHRSQNDFAWYQNGSFYNAPGDPGTGGSVLMNLYGGSDPKLSVPKLKITTPTAAADSSPMLLLGDPSTTHMQFSNASVVVWADSSNTTQATMNVHTGAGGILNLGSTSGNTNIRGEVTTSLDHITLGAKRLSISYGAPSSPNEGDVWIDIDA